MKARAIHARAICVVLALLAAGPLLLAQSQTFDIVSFQPPAGWASAQDSDHVTFTFIDNAARTFVMLAVYSSAPASGDGQKDFAAEWREVVAKSFNAGSAPSSVTGRTRAGLAFHEGSGQVKQNNGQPAYVKLLAFSAAQRRFSVMLVASTQGALERQQAATQSFLDNLKAATHGGVSPSAGATPAMASGASTAPRPGKGITGVWMGYKTFVGSYEPQPRFYSFYEDGQIYEDLPREGFIGFNREQSKADQYQRNYWGAYAFDGNSGEINKPGVRYPEKLLSEGAGKLKIDSAHFYRCHPVDGLRLQGAWTSLANPNDPDLDRWEPGHRPIFRFTNDGTFIDEGVFAMFLKSGDPRQDAAGAGTYEIRDYTLVLRFADGRVKQLALAGLLGADPAVSNDVLFISRSVFRKRK
ncbi:MAG TPA: hypothetical protein VF532_14275 [Candidatus Angelobacter sp.]